MFSKNIKDQTYLIECFYIAGISDTKLSELDTSKETHLIEPEILYLQPRNTSTDLEEANLNILNVIPTYSFFL
jgi:hypothetical protein